jgi:hypothetical protein
VEGRHVETVCALVIFSFLLRKREKEKVNWKEIITTCPAIHGILLIKEHNFINLKYKVCMFAA